MVYTILANGLSNRATQVLERRYDKECFANLLK